MLPMMRTPRNASMPGRAHWLSHQRFLIRAEAHEFDARAKKSAMTSKAKVGRSSNSNRIRFGSVAGTRRQHSADGNASRCDAR